MVSAESNLFSDDDYSAQIMKKERERRLAEEKEMAIRNEAALLGLPRLIGKDGMSSFRN